MSQPLPFASFSSKVTLAKAVPQKIFSSRDVLIPRSPAFQQELVRNRPTMTRLGVICEALTGLLKK